MRTNPLSLTELYRHIRGMLLYHDHDYGMLALLGTALLLAFLIGIPYGESPALFVAGEIADQTVVAKRDFLVEDEEGTKARRDKIRAIQPLVFDYNRNVATRVRENMLNLLHAINTFSIHNDLKGLEKIQKQFNTSYDTNFDLDTFKALAEAQTQDFAFDNLLPWIDSRLSDGILSDSRILYNTPNAILIRDTKTLMERLRQTSTGLIDLQSLTVAMGNQIRANHEIPENSKQALLKIFPHFLAPTLNLNQEETNQKTQAALDAIKPIYFQIHRGEIIVREGDIVTREAQLKMQALYNNSGSSFNFYKAGGTFLLGLVLILGLFMTPSGQRGRILHTKDQIFIALILALVGIFASSLYHFGQSISSELDTSLLPYAFPVSGIAGLAVLIFAARRYCVIGFLMAFFTCLLFQGDVSLFLFYFTSAMINTWLILRSQSRQDVVWSVFSLFIALLITGFASALITDIDTAKYLKLVYMLAANAVLSVVLLFALSPVLEMIFGYTTRFRLMELMNLDHPLLQELMMKTPGTYHHCLVVSNLVEAGAKAIGANSLLAKVGALYHDIGKLAHPNYFSENQFDGINPHDKLSPRMSVLIIFSHVKFGQEMAQKHRLGKEITDMICQHHGTRMPMAFYHKAVKLGENPKEEDFRYAGPRPQTKEAAILMMADTLEAAVRSLTDPSSTRISTTVETLVKNIYAEGQLDEADLTFKDLNKLIASFTRTLRALNHQRVAYPAVKIPGVSFPKDDAKEENGKETAKESDRESGIKSECKASAADKENSRPEEKTPTAAQNTPRQNL